MLGVGEGMAILLLVIAILVITALNRRDLAAWAAGFDGRCRDHMEEMVVTLTAIREVADSLRINRKETAQAKDDIVAKVLPALKEAPSRTAAEVVEALKKNGEH
jgi:hypothetical protein